MTTLPRRALRDARTLVTSPVGARRPAAPARRRRGSLVAFFPHEGTGQAASAQAVTAVPAAHRPGARRTWRSGGTSSRRRTCRSRPTAPRSLIVKFSDFMCPGCRPDLRGVQADRGEVRRQQGREVHHEAVPARARVQPVRADGQSLRLVRGGARRSSWRDRRERPISWRIGSSPTRALGRQRLTSGARVVKQARAARSAASRTSTRSTTGRDPGSEDRRRARRAARRSSRRRPSSSTAGGSSAGIPPQAFEGIIELELKRAK